MRKGALYVGGLLALFLLGVGTWFVTQEKVPNAELRYVEHSPTLGEEAGAVIPASCESNYPHYGGECIPPAPTGAWAAGQSCNSGQIYIAWNPSAWATNYRIYHYNWGTGAWEHWYNSPDNAELVGGYAAGSYHAFAMIAENGWGTSGWSNVAYVYAPQICPPAAVTNFSVTPGSCDTGALLFQWTGSAGATNYRTYHYNYGTGNWEHWYNAGGAFWGYGYAPGSYHAFNMLAENAGGTSPWTTTYYVYAPNVCSSPTPANLRGFPEACGTGRINLYWDAAANASYYKVYMHNGSQWVHIASPASGYQPVTGLIANNPYTFTVTSVNSAGVESGMHPQIWVTSPNVCAPTTPTNFTATPAACSTGAINFSWNAVSGATNYYVSRWNGSAWVGIADTSGTSVSVGGHILDNPYTFTVQAINSGGWSAMHPQVWATPPSCKPVGNVDGVSCSAVWGWTCDQDNWGAALDVHMYEGGTYLGNTTANVVRSDVAGVCGGTTAHGFNWSIPNSLKTGTSRTITSYPINTPSGNNVPLNAVTLVCGMPDLTISAPTVSAASVTQGGNITFYTNTMRNAGNEVAGAHNVGGFYIDYNGDGNADYTAPISRITSATAIGGVYSQQVTWNVPMNAPPGANYRVGYIVDVSNEVNESNEGNNFSGWSAPFSVTLQNCAAATVSNCVMPSTQSGQSAGTCAAGYAGSCSYSCGGNPATWSLVTNSCAAPTITQLEICLWDGTTATSCGTSLTVPTGTPLAIRWNSQNADNCARQAGPADFSTGGAVSGIDTTVNASSNTMTTSTYTLICTRGGNAATAALRSVSNTTFNNRPVLTFNERVVPVGGAVTMTWDTNNGNEGACTLSGGGLTSAILTNGTGDAETGTASVTINGETTFTLTCQQSAVETITVIPREWEN